MYMKENFVGMLLLLITGSLYDFNLGFVKDKVGHRYEHVSPVCFDVHSPSFQNSPCVKKIVKG